MHQCDSKKIWVKVIANNAAVRNLQELLWSSDGAIVVSMIEGYVKHVVCVNMKKRKPHKYTLAS